MTSASAISLPEGFAAAPVKNSGLPPRIQTALRARGITTLGQLSQPPPDCEKLSGDDRAWLARVAGYVRHLDGKKTPPPLHLSEWLQLFLPPRQVEILETHFGLRPANDRPVWRASTLQQTGARFGITRERVRQLLRDARATLRRPLPLWAAGPIFHAMENALQAVGGVMDTAQLERQESAAWAGYVPIGVFHGLADLQPERVGIYRGFFSLFPSTLLDRAERALQDRLRRAGRLLCIAEIAGQLPAKAQPPPPYSAEPLIQMLARHIPGMLATVDGRVGLAARDGAELLGEILLTTGEANLRTLQAELNARLLPESQRGSGYIRDTLQRAPRIRRTAPVRYELSGGIQTSLPL